MKRIVKLTENDLTRIVKRVIEEQENEMSEEVIINLLEKIAKKHPTEEFDDVYDWMNVIFSQVEYILENTFGHESDDLRQDYDYVLMRMWDKDDDDDFEDNF